MSLMQLSRKENCVSYRIFFFMIQSESKMCKNCYKLIYSNRLSILYTYYAEKTVLDSFFFSKKITRRRHSSSYRMSKTNISSYFFVCILCAMLVHMIYTFAAWHFFLIFLSCTLHAQGNNACFCVKNLLFFLIALLFFPSFTPFLYIIKLCHLFKQRCCFIQVALCQKKKLCKGKKIMVLHKHKTL